MSVKECEWEGAKQTETFKWEEERESAYFHFVRFVFELQINVSIYIEIFECASSNLSKSAKQFNSFAHCSRQEEDRNRNRERDTYVDEECLHLFQFSVSFSVVCCCFIAK